MISTARAGLTLRPQLPRALGSNRNLDILDAVVAFHHNLNIAQYYLILMRHEHVACHGGQRTLFFSVEGAFLILLASFIIIPALRAGLKIIRSRKMCVKVRIDEFILIRIGVNLLVALWLRP